MAALSARRWVIRDAPAEAGAIRLVQRRIYVLPTAAGLGFATALLVMLVASINYHLSLGYGLVFLLGGAAVASIVHAFRNLLGLVIRAGRCTPVFCGEAAGFELVLENPARRRRPALRLRARGEVTAFELDAEEARGVVLACPTLRRGELALGRTVLETTWPLGLIRAWGVFVPELRCLVYPAPEAAAPALPDGGGEAEGGRRAAHDGDDDFAGLRAHRPADSPRHVAWKILARGGPMLTKQFTALAGSDLVLDWAALPPALDTEQRLSRLSAWLLAAEDSGRPYGLALPGARIAVGRGSAHLHRCLRQLALFGTAPPDHEPPHA